MISLKAIAICGALLLHQNFTRDWNGSDLPGHSFAKFERFSGKQDFNIKLDKKDDFVFKYKSNLSQGSLHLEVKSSTKTVISKDLEASDEGEVKVLNPSSEKYRFTLKGKEAKGSYDITYNKI